MQIRSQKPKREQHTLAIRKRTAAVSIDLRIMILRCERVILDTALAERYNVSVKRLNEQAKRNRKRFPADFMFQVTPRENKSRWTAVSAICLHRSNQRLSSLPYFIRLRYRLPSTCRTMASMSSGSRRNATISPATAFGSRSTR